MTKPYAQWTEAEVVEYVSREVPETAVDVGTLPVGTVWKDGADFFTNAGSLDEGVEQTMFVEGPILVALWFRAAWEWLERGEVETGRDQLNAMLMGEPNIWVAWDDTRDKECAMTDPLPTSVHALGAACLLAAGKAVP